MGKRIKVTEHIERDASNYYRGAFFGYRFIYIINSACIHRKSLLRSMRRHAERMGFDVDWSHV